MVKAELNVREGEGHWLSLVFDKSILYVVVILWLTFNIVLRQT